MAMNLQLSTAKGRPRSAVVDRLNLAIQAHQLSVDVAEQADRETALITSPRPFLIKGLLVVGVVFGGFGTWAATAPLDSGVVAPGVVIVDGQRKQIQHPEGGVIRAILVKAGDRITAGQVLVRLDPTAAEASWGVARIAHDNALAEEARLLAELEGRSAPRFPPELDLRAVDPEVAKILDAQRHLFAARRASLAGETAILEAQIEQSNDEIAGLRANQESVGRQIVLVREELEGQQFLLAKGLTKKTRVLELEKEHERLRGVGGTTKAQIAEIESRIGEKQLQIMQERKAFREDVVAQLRDARATVLDQRERLDAAAHVLEQAELRAPVDGVVVNLQTHTEGGVVASGEVIMELVPEGDELVIDARVPLSDIDSVSVGQRANILLPAFQQITTPTLHGDVTHVSADRIVPQDGDQPPYYRAYVNVPKEELARLGDGRRLQAGMAADVIITTGERTVLEYLLRPIMLNFARAWREE